MVSIIDRHAGGHGFYLLKAIRLPMFSAGCSFTSPPMLDSSVASGGLVERAAFGTNNVTHLH
jgi:hypothetical protein